MLLSTQKRIARLLDLTGVASLLNLARLLNLTGVPFDVLPHRILPARGTFIFSNFRRKSSKKTRKAGP